LTERRTRRAPRTPRAPVADPTQPVQPSTGMVLPQVEQHADGLLDPTFYEGLDVESQGAVAESLPQPPQNEATYEHKMTTEGNVEGPQISGLETRDITATSATIAFTTSEPGTTRVRGGTSPGDFSQASSIQEEYVTDHQAPLTGLTAGTTYYIEVNSRDAGGNMMGAQTQFTTAAASR
jgi:hypothetical protein